MALWPAAAAGAPLGWLKSLRLGSFRSWPQGLRTVEDGAMRNVVRILVVLAVALAFVLLCAQPTPGA
jgi:uncharacterized membrane protein YccC